MVKICDNLYFRAEPTQYILVECGKREKIDKVTRKPTGEMGDYETVIGYYVSLENLVKGCKSYALKKKIIDDDLQTLGEILAAMHKIDDEISELLCDF